MIQKVPSYFKKRVRRYKLKYLFKGYLRFFYLDHIIFFERQDLSYIPKTLVFFKFPLKQFLFQIYYLPLCFNINLSMGAFIKWNFKRAKFYRRQLRSITPFILLFWQYFDEILREDATIVVTNYNFYIYTILERYFDVVGYLPYQLIFHKSFVNILYKPKRIKKRVFKLLQKI